MKSVTRTSPRFDAATDAHAQDLAANATTPASEQLLCDADLLLVAGGEMIVNLN